MLRIKEKVEVPKLCPEKDHWVNVLLWGKCQGCRIGEKVEVVKKDDPTTCEVADSVKAFNCQREEQCDDCFIVDHKKGCSWCEHYEHGAKKLEVACKCA